MPILTDALTLPCGAVLTNRVAKAAITEGLAAPDGSPTAELEGIYDDWGQGGLGLLITGNVIVNGDHLERPGNVIIDAEPDATRLAALKSWTKVATQHGTHLWAQLSHSGRQTPKLVNASPLSSSPVKVGLPLGLFGMPREMTPLQIEAAVAEFARAAEICQRVGFTGIQIHAAHGYLLSSFLSPNANLRKDAWGYGVDGRARLLLDVVAHVRKVVGKSFPICVKLNSADFQRGGFAADECEMVATRLEAAGIDMLEVSGGSYESPVMLGPAGDGNKQLPQKSASTLAREAYFLDFARVLRSRVDLPVMLTGGLRSASGMQAALDEGIDMLGIARPLCVDPYCVKRLLAGQTDRLESWETKIHNTSKMIGTGSPLKLVRTLNSFANIYWFYAQLYRAGRGAPIDHKLNPLLALVEVLNTEKRVQAKRRKVLRGALAA